jgi:hypothetical protein
MLVVKLVMSAIKPAMQRVKLNMQRVNAESSFNMLILTTWLPTDAP